MARTRAASRTRALRLGGLGVAAALTSALLPAQVTAAGSGGDACDRRVNSSYQKLLECMTVKG